MTESCFVVTGRNRITPVRFSDIRYFENSLRLVFLHTTDGHHRFYGKLAHLESLLDKRFCRCHCSFIINLDKAVRLERRCFVMDCGQVIPISQRRYTCARTAFLRHFSER